MTKSAKDTVEAPGRNVKQKAGLNHEILKPNRKLLEHQLANKAGKVFAGRARLYIADLCGLWSCRQGESQDPDVVPVYGL